MNKLEKLFGMTGKDMITGFTGVITGCCSYIGGNQQVLLSPVIKENGGYQEPQWFDTARIEILPSCGQITLPCNMQTNSDPTKPIPASISHEVNTGNK